MPLRGGGTPPRSSWSNQATRSSPPIQRVDHPSGRVRNDRHLAHVRLGESRCREIEGVGGQDTAVTHSRLRPARARRRTPGGRRWLAHRQRTGHAERDDRRATLRSRELARQLVRGRQLEIHVNRRGLELSVMSLGPEAALCTLFNGSVGFVLAGEGRASDAPIPPALAGRVLIEFVESGDLDPSLWWWR